VLHVAVASLASNSQNETRDSELERYVDRYNKENTSGPRRHASSLWHAHSTTKK